MGKGRHIKPSQLAAELKRVGSVATEKQFTASLQKLSIGAFRDLVMFSAVDTGFLRSNWDATTGNAPNEKLKEINGGAYGDAKWPGTKITTGDKITLFNNTVYARYLETGTPDMRAQPMIQPTYFRLLSQAKSIVSALSKEKTG